MADHSPETFPYDDLHPHLEDHETGREAATALRDATSGRALGRDDVERHVGTLSAIPEIRARIANWFDSPSTHLWLDGLTEIGL